MSDADEFAMLSENAAEAGLPWATPPVVRRVDVEVGDGRTVSALAWGSGPPEFVLLHGGAQNAHTWDTVALALDRPLLAIDLPGHGHSSWRADHDYAPATLAADVAVALRSLLGDQGERDLWGVHAINEARDRGRAPATVVGMSLGGLTAICLAADHADLVDQLVLVDITPSTDAAKAEPVLAFISGPERFGSFQEMLDRTIAFNPSRSVSSLRRGVIHNARELPDGSWAWRWDPEARWRSSREVSDSGVTGVEALWGAVVGIRVPVVLVRGERSTVVSDDDVIRLIDYQPGTTVEVVADSGHSIQGDQPVALAGILSRFVDFY
jgi:pimeloyl-ACP methyl ester carboxylesterase